MADPDPPQDPNAREKVRAEAVDALLAVADMLEEFEPEAAEDALAIARDLGLI